MNKHLFFIYSIAVGTISAIVWLDTRYAHAEDVTRTNAQIMIEVQQLSIDSKKSFNEYKIDQYSNKMKQGLNLKPYEAKDFDYLQTERHMIINQEVELDRLRQEIK